MKNNFTILLTDDNKEFIQNLGDILELKGYSILKAADGFQALEIIKNSSVDLVMMDIKMPVMNGVETYKRIKKISPGMPVIMLTAYAFEELIQESLHEGAFACLKKPIDFDELFLTIDQVIFKGSMILVLDDSGDLCANLKSVLDQKGYCARIANDEQNALKRVKESFCDVLILDTKMPPLNGFETYMKLKKISPLIVVVVVAGQAEELEATIEIARKKGAYALLEKPLNIDKLLAILSRISGHKDLNLSQTL